MGVFASFAFHARDRNGPHRASDHRKAQIRKFGRRERWLGACLTAWFAAVPAAAETIRIAYFHTELSRDGPGLMLRDILAGDAQVESLVQVVRAVGPDVLVLGDVDYDLESVALKALAERLDYPHQFSRRPNRGLQSGRDLDGDGAAGGPGDAEGYAAFAGQGGMAVLSRFQIAADDVRDFTGFRWADLPDNQRLGDGHDPERLSTTVHWDVPVATPGGPLHLLIWHATAPVFDGPEDRNGRRNRGETAFWLRYLEGALGFDPPERFVLAGTANADPFDGESRPDALRALLAHVQDPRPASAGAVLADERDGGANQGQIGPPELDTVDWPDGPGRPGNLRVDYVLPATGLIVTGSGVLWPAKGSLREHAERASRHRLIWLDIEMGDRLADGR